MKNRHTNMLSIGMLMLAADTATASAPTAAASPATTDPAKPADGAPAAPAKGKAPPKPSKPREEVYSKEDLLGVIAAQFGNILGVRVSKAHAWDMFKASIASACELAKVKPLSLAGVGRFHTMDSQRSVKANKPAKRMRFKPSSRITDILNEGGLLPRGHSGR